MGKRVLVTGATGFVGANLVRRLLGEGHEVHAVVRPRPDLPASAVPWRLSAVWDRLKIHRIDLAGRESVGGLVADTAPHWIFHLAAYGAYSWETDTARIIATNFLGTTVLLDAALAAGCGHFVNTGSSAEYGWKDHAPSEDEHLDPNSQYAVAKAAATMYCRTVARRSGTRITTLRLYSAFGPWEEPARFVPTLAVRGLEGGLPPLVNPGVGRDFVYVDDVCEAYLRAVAGDPGEPGAVFNVGTGVQVSIRDAVEVARRELGVAAEPEWGSMPDRAWDSHVWVSDPRKISRVLGWKPVTDFAEGFRRTVAWLKADPAVMEHYRRHAGSGRSSR